MVSPGPDGAAHYGVDYVIGVSPRLTLAGRLRDQWVPTGALEDAG